ncbi:hypothetical protein QUF80_21035 [Desulfococcaceae bacterium HSG8]|nr:hypothetical protein [Desulfococcaceae bacterium HSG8]
MKMKITLFLGIIALFFPIHTIKAVNVPITGGDEHTLAIRDDGTVWAWGTNDSGQLGNGKTEDSNRPVQVFGLKNVTAIKGGASHSIALGSDASVWGWGDNSYGQLGDDEVENSTKPIQVSDFYITAIAAGLYHTVLLKADKTVWSCGSNMFGQLGIGTTEDSAELIQISGFKNITAIASGGNHTAAIDSSGLVWTWGSNSNGQLGNGKLGGISKSPQEVSGVNSVIAIACGGYHMIALRGDGKVWTWGSNSNGQLGNGETGGYSLEPVEVSGIGNVVAVAGGRKYTMALRNDKTVWAWGANSQGQLGDGTTDENGVPVQVASLDNVTAIAGGALHKIAVRNDGTIVGWGANYNGQLGNGLSGEGSDSSEPVEAAINMFGGGLSDVIFALTAAAGMTPDMAVSDINGDGRVGIAEAVHFLRVTK